MGKNIGVVLVSLFLILGCSKPNTFFENKKLCENNDANGCYSLAYMYDTGEMIPEDHKNAVKYYLMAADMGHAQAKRNLTLLGHRVYSDYEEYEAAFKLLKLAAKEGDVEERYYLGRVYFRGIYSKGMGRKPDFKKAVKWFRLSAKQGDVRAQDMLALLCLIGECAKYNDDGMTPKYDDKGKTIKNNNREAVKWYRLAAEKGYAKAQFNLGLRYEYGTGIKQDYEKAVKWIELAAEQGHVDAQYHLGMVYKKGEIAKKDYKKAMKWFKLLIDYGFPQAQYHIGDMYENGLGVQQSYKEAIKWYRLSVNQGGSSAKRKLGILYKNGQGVKQDRYKAFDLFKESCDAGNLGSCMELGEAYIRGEGVEQNYSEGIKLYDKICNGNPLNYDACLRLGKIYEEGKVVGKDMLRSESYYSLACFYEFDEACEKLKNN